MGIFGTRNWRVGLAPRQVTMSNIVAGDNQFKQQIWKPWAYVQGLLSSLLMSSTHQHTYTYKRSPVAIPCYNYLKFSEVSPCNITRLPDGFRVWLLKEDDQFHTDEYIYLCFSRISAHQPVLKTIQASGRSKPTIQQAVLVSFKAIRTKTNSQLHAHSFSCNIYTPYIMLIW